MTPIEMAKETEKIVCRNLERKYYRFRGARFYGGIATSDTVGCNLRCCFCWAWNVVTQPERYGTFYSPEEVAEKLKTIAEKAGFRQVRISGNEPTIGKQHLLQVLENLKDSGLLFILETNGTLIDEQYAKDLSKYRDFIHIRISLKGTNEDEFKRLTGFDGFQLQINALKNLLKYEVPCHAACMVSFSPEENIKKLRARLAEICQELVDSLEIEKLVFYGDVRQRLEKLSTAVSKKPPHFSQFSQKCGVELLAN
jgi:uncharacterized Fe-S cluster-containing radical SAM superfamily protein